MGARSIAARRSGRIRPRGSAGATGARRPAPCANAPAMLERLRAALEDFGRMILFAFEAAAWAVRPPFRMDLVLTQMAFIGVGSAFIVGATGLAAGMVF